MKKTAGISLMLLIFLSLCLITFSLLSLSGATADAKLAQNSAERTTEYYAAVSEANEILNEIDTQLAAAWREALQEAQAGPDSEDADGADDSTAAAMTAYADACGTLSIADTPLAWTANVSGSNANADTSESIAINDAGAESQTVSIIGTFQYDVSVTEDQLLHVELSVLWPESD
ncbi:MAG: hypothetical protein LUH53_02945, partial [Lachnospiraceae bacterium]|nr:hypothetical protein [Lachnospiraceae bacterium]